MTTFDGLFAQNYVYPLAVQAYQPTFTLAYSNPGEILVDTTSASYLAATAAAPSVSSIDMLGSMLRPVGAGNVPTTAVVAAAEGLGTAAADPDAPLPAIAVAGAAAVAPPLPVDKRFGWVCVDGARLIVSFRGTQTAGDWLNNIDFVHEPYRPDPAAGNVHQGFQHVYYAIRDSLISLVTARLANIAEILVTGHSLGGALTTLAMPDLLSVIAATQPDAPVLAPTLYNLESPRVGNRAYQTFFNSKTSCWRIVNIWDVVPHVPPALAGFVHVGTQLTIDSGFSLDVAKNHVLETGCLPGLIAWNQKHPPTGVAALGASAPGGRDVPPGVSD
jgi:hypothetical protein